MKQLFSKTTLETWNKLIAKLRYYKKECRKKDKIIKALEDQLSTLKDMYV